MPPSDDMLQDPVEDKDARLEVRTRKSVKDAIRRAAQLSGVDDSAFIISTVYAAAKATIAAHETTVLADKADRDAFFAALDNPPAPTDRLRHAAQVHKDRIADAD